MVPPSRLTVEVALPSRFRAVFILSSSLTPATGSNQRDDKNQQEGDETEDLEGREIPSQHCKQLVHVFLLSCSGGIPPYHNGISRGFDGQPFTSLFRSDSEGKR